MAVAAIAGIGNFVSFIPALPRLQQITPQQGFVEAVRRSLTGATVEPRVLTTTSDGAQSVATLTQALFDNWVASLQDSAQPWSFDRLLATQLDLATGVGFGAAQSALGPNAATQGMTAGLVSLFGTLELMGA